VFREPAKVIKEMRKVIKEMRKVFTEAGKVITETRKVFTEMKKVFTETISENSKGPKSGKKRGFWGPDAKNGQISPDSSKMGCQAGNRVREPVLATDGRR